MNYKHIYISYKDETSPYLKSQVINLMNYFKQPLIIFIKEPETKNSLIEKIMEKTDIPYEVVNTLKEAKKKVLSYSELEVVVQSRDYRVLLYFNKLFTFNKNKIITIYDVRGANSEEAVYYNNLSLYNNCKQRIKSLIIDYVIKKSNIVTFVSPNLKKLKLKNNKKNIENSLIVPTTIDQPPSSIIKKGDNIRIIYSGGTKRKWQKINEVIDLMEYINQKYTGFKFEFIMLVDDPKYIKELTLNREFSPTVKNVSYDEVIQELFKTDYAIILRDDDIINAVATPTKFTEYLITGNKIIYSGTLGSFDLLPLEILESNLVHVNNVYEGKYTFEKSKVPIDNSKMINVFSSKSNSYKYIYEINKILKKKKRNNIK